MNNEQDYVSKILGLVEEYSRIKYKSAEFIPGKTTIPPSGKVLGADELKYMTESVLEGWLTGGRFNTKFEKRFSRYVGASNTLTVNSGSSANLLALSSLTF